MQQILKYGLLMIDVRGQLDDLRKGFDEIRVAVK